MLIFNVTLHLPVQSFQTPMYSRVCHSRRAEHLHCCCRSVHVQSRRQTDGQRFSSVHESRFARRCGFNFHGCISLNAPNNYSGIHVVMDCWLELFIPYKRSIKWHGETLVCVFERTQSHNYNREVCNEDQQPRSSVCHVVMMIMMQSRGREELGTVGLSLSWDRGDETKCACSTLSSLFSYHSKATSCFQALHQGRGGAWLDIDVPLDNT